MSASVIVIDSSSQLCRRLESFLDGHGHRVRTATSGEEGLALCSREMPALVLLDLHLPGIDGMETLRRIKEMDRNCRVVMITQYDTARSAVKAMKLGAEDYITKPVPLEELRALVEKLGGARSNDAFQKGKGLDEIVGDSAAIHHLFEMVRRISRTSATVLITGESGTGKELVARAIHLNSERSKRPFLSINCASIPANLLESEMFGYEKGAFTDAKIQKRGLIEVAGWGTLFLDEIGLMSLDLQSKILTVLETLRFRRLGGIEERSANVRFIAATNKDLEKAIKTGEFREDLYYRLNVIPIQLPPLRERRDDILLLAGHFLDQYSRLHNMNHRELSPEAKALLMTYPWSGNVRELKNVLERAVLLSDGPTIDAADLFIYRSPHLAEPIKQASIEVPETGLINISFPPWGLPLEDLERKVIEEALTHTCGNVSGAARLLHLSRDTLRYRMHKHGIRPQ